MLNLSQRLILGCFLLVCLMAALVAVTHRALWAVGQSALAWGFLLASILVAFLTAFFVLRPIRNLAGDARRIAQGNLEHRV